MVLLQGTFFGHSQVLILNDNDPDPADNSSMLEVRSDDAGLLVPFVTLDYDIASEIVAPDIPGIPANGLIIFHNGANNIPKGLWYYDASIPGWFNYTDWSSGLNADLINYGEIYEEHDYGSGTSYPLTNTHFFPWRSASAGLLGPEFVFRNNVTVITETGTALADQIEVLGPYAVYSVKVTITAASITAGNEFMGMLYINNAPANNVFFKHTFQNKDYPANCTASGLIALNPNDRIDFRLSCTSASEGVKIELLNVKLEKVAEL